MPSRAPSHCGRCGVPHQGRCTQADKDRPSAHQRGYGRQWQKLRAEHLELEPDCVSCGAVATDVDHIIARSQGGVDAHHNLQSLCHSCHSKKTVRDDGGFGNQRTIDVEKVFNEE